MKAILVIDVPEGINQEDYIFDVIAHYNADKPCEVYKIMLQWKDIYHKPMPEKICCGEKHSEAGMIYEAWVAGWNECVDYLEEREK